MISALVPSEVDLRDFAYMPLDVLRLRDSDLAAEATDAEFRAAVMLWCASWHQVPAASLPDNDAVLTKLAGLGRDRASWVEVRGGALRGWVKCEDGRLYHPVVAEKANEAWQQKQAYRERAANARAAKAAKASPTLDPKIDPNADLPTGHKGTEQNGTNQEDNLHPSQPHPGEGEKLFQDFMKGYPKGKFISERKARLAFFMLSASDWGPAVRGAKIYGDGYRAKPDTEHPTNPEKFLIDGLFGNFAASATGPPMFRVLRDSPQGEAWSRYRRETPGEKDVWSNGAWWCPSEWPPNVKAAA